MNGNDSDGSSHGCQVIMWQSWRTWGQTSGLSLLCHDTSGWWDVWGVIWLNGLSEKYWKYLQPSVLQGSRLMACFLRALICVCVFTARGRQMNPACFKHLDKMFYSFCRPYQTTFFFLTVRLLRAVCFCDGKRWEKKEKDEGTVLRFSHSFI